MVKTLVLVWITMFVVIACTFNKGNAISENSSNVSEGLSDEVIPDSIVQFLIVSAATDFHTHYTPTPADFRRVEIGYISTGDEKQYILCGEFLSEKGEWIKLTTIKTSGYEQYIGDQAEGYCKHATMIVTDGASLSAMLKNKLTELK